MLLALVLDFFEEVRLTLKTAQASSARDSQRSLHGSKKEAPIGAIGAFPKIFVYSCCGFAASRRASEDPPLPMASAWLRGPLPAYQSPRSSLLSLIPTLERKQVYILEW